MADYPQDIEKTPEATGFHAHDWYSYEGYKSVHFGQIEHLLREGTIQRDGVSFREIRDGRALLQVNVQGRLVCADDVIIKVEKWLDVRRNQRRHYEVKGTDYAYHAWLRGTRQHLFRYCSAHGLDDLHYHRFDLETGKEVEQVRIPLHELPLLGDFIMQAVELGRSARRPRLE